MEKIEIVEYSDTYKDYFKKLNCEWIEKFFVIEPTDVYVLNYPEEVVLKPGGYIYFAKLNDEIIGTFAMMKIDETTYEFAKMAVSESFQNRGIGKMLLNVAIYKARQLGLVRLVLYTNTYLESAVSLYRRFGFQEIPKTDFHNNRANLKMEKVLAKKPDISHYSWHLNKNGRNEEFDLNYDINETRIHG